MEGREEGSEGGARKEGWERGGVGERKGGREGEGREEVGRSKAEMRGGGRHMQFASTA